VSLALKEGSAFKESISNLLELGRMIGATCSRRCVRCSTGLSFQDKSFPELLASDPRVTAHLSRSAVDSLLDPTSHTGFSARIAHEQAEVARRFAKEIHAHLES
jgi:hypothetical protein